MVLNKKIPNCQNNSQGQPAPGPRALNELPN